MSHPDHDPCPTQRRKKAAPFKLECVIVCDRYADFLQQTLPHNKQLFDRVVVVTSFEDRATQRICEYNNVQCIRTDVMEARKGLFCKGKGINKGLAALDRDGWVLHLDADMYLPPQTRLLLAAAALDPGMTYGIDRFLVEGWEAWQEFIERPRLQHEDGTWIHLDAFPMGTRVMHGHEGGYVNIGFFQLWHPRTSGVHAYPEGHTAASREDTLFVRAWPRGRRGFIPEIVGYHLQSPDASHGANWGGRKTSHFSFAPKELTVYGR